MVFAGAMHFLITITSPTLIDKFILKHLFYHHKKNSHFKNYIFFTGSILIVPLLSLTGWSIH